MTIAALVEGVVGSDLSLRVECYDGSGLGPKGAPCTLVIRSPDALRYLIQAPGELGFARAYVSGAMDVEGSLLEGLDLSEGLPNVARRPLALAAIVRFLGSDAVRRLAPPPEEIHLSGRRHRRSRDSDAISAHYDLPNNFYGLILGESMTYSCGVFRSDDEPLDMAQQNKHDLICSKLGLEEGNRLLDIGCGWGAMVIHAARRYGARCVGVTLSKAQFDLGQKRITEAGVAGLVELRIQDYRDIDDGPFDAVSSVGMAEHVGWGHLDEYAESLARLVKPEGRVLNHAISNWISKRPLRRQDGFIQRYVFPDGELYDVGVTVAALQRAGLEVRHVESLREHYALTLRHWVTNLEASWDDAVERIGLNRARVWRLYMSVAARNFEGGHSAIHQTLAVRQSDAGASGVELRPTFAG